MIEIGTNWLKGKERNIIIVDVEMCYSIGEK